MPFSGVRVSLRCNKSQNTIGLFEKQNPTVNERLAHQWMIIIVKANENQKTNLYQVVEKGGSMGQDSLLWQQAYSAYTSSSKSPRRETSPVITTKPEPMVLQEEIRKLDTQIKGLIRLKKEKQRLLKRSGGTMLRSAYYDKPIFLYVLRLQNGCYYVGMSRNVELRFKKHLRGKGAKWTKLSPPIEIVETIPTELISDSEASKLEDQLTIKYARKYGKDKVRGGGYCQTRPHWTF